MAAENQTSTVPPLFVKDSDIGTSGGTSISPYEMCSAVTRTTGLSKLVGVQKINNLWRIYVTDATTRLETFVKRHILINGKDIPLYDQNPYISRQQIGPQGGRKHVPLSSDKLTIKYVPLSVSNEEIKAMLEENKVELRSPINYGKIRDADGQLTRYKNGDRFVYVTPFSPPLPRQQHVGDFSCVVVHHGKDSMCRACGERGHKIGDQNCKAKPKEQENIMPFRSYEHPLSNHYPCELTISDNVFKSLEHAYLWSMSMELGKPQLAANIMDSVHAGRAKQLSKNIADDETRWKWESENEDIMKELLVAKAEQCEEFCNCLVENHGKILAEATPSKIWGTGLSVFATQHCSPDYWPGKNLLGAMLMDLTDILVQREEQSEEVEEQSKGAEGEANEAEVTRVSQDSSDTQMDMSDGTVVQISEDTAGQNNSACPDTSSRVQSPAPVTTARNAATPTRIKPKPKKVGNSKDSKDKSNDKGRKNHVTSTPQPSIKTSFLEVSKRKGMDSSPDGICESEPKAQKQDNEKG